MQTDLVFVAIADHDMTLFESQLFHAVIDDLRNAGFKVTSRPNDRSISGENIVHSVEYDLSQCSCLVAIVDRDSLTLGDILGVARMRVPKIAILCLKSEKRFQNHERVSRTLLGYAQRGYIEFKIYHDEHHAAKLALEFVQKKTNY